MKLFPAFLCWNLPVLSFSIAFNHISSAVGFSFWRLCFLLPVQDLFWTSSSSSRQLLLQSIYRLYFWTNTTCSFFLLMFCFVFRQKKFKTKFISRLFSRLWLQNSKILYRLRKFRFNMALRNKKLIGVSNI